MWQGSLLLNLLRGEPDWKRGRVRPDLVQECQLERWDATRIEGICSWGSKPMPRHVDLALDDDPDEFIIEAGAFFARDRRPPDATLRLRALSWFLLYFLETFDVDAEGRARFGGTPRYRSLVHGLLSPDGAGVCRKIADHGRLRSDFDAYRVYVRRKLALGHHRDGVIVEWSDPRNPRKTGRPEDDLVR